MNAIKMLLVLILLSSTGVANAQQRDWRNDLPPDPGWVGCSVNGGTIWVRPGTCNNGNVQQQSPIGMQQGTQQGGLQQGDYVVESGDCGFLSKPTIAGSLLGGWAGSTANTNRGFHTGLGLFVGGLLGSWTNDVVNPCKRVVVHPQPQMQSRSSEGGVTTRSGGEVHTRTIPSKCSVDDDIVKGLSSEDCDLVNLKLANSKTQIRHISRSVAGCVLGGKTNEWLSEQECKDSGGVYTPSPAEGSSGGMNLANNQTQQEKTAACYFRGDKTHSKVLTEKECLKWDGN